MKYRLINASPEYVLDFIEANEFIFKSEEELQEALFQRNEPLINLALALYGNNEDILCKLYESGNLDLQTACMAGKGFGPKWSSPELDAWFNDKTYILELVKESSVKFADDVLEANNETKLLATLLSNPESTHELLLLFINRQWQFAELNDSVYKYLLISMHYNKQPLLFDKEGVSIDNDLAESLWQLTETLDVNLQNTVLLINLLGRCPINDNCYISNSINILKTASRWFAPTEDETLPKSFDWYLHEHKYFGDYDFIDDYEKLRFIIASQYPYYNDDFKKLSESDDRPIRLAYYEQCDYLSLSYEGSDEENEKEEVNNISKRYNRDGHDYLLAMKNNERVGYSYLENSLLEKLVECAENNYQKDESDYFRQGLFEDFKKLYEDKNSAAWGERNRKKLKELEEPKAIAELQAKANIKYPMIFLGIAMLIILVLSKEH